MADSRPPVNPHMPGAEVHGAIVDTILRGDFFSRPKWVFDLEWLLAPASIVLSTLLPTWTRADKFFEIALELLDFEEERAALDSPD